MTPRNADALAPAQLPELYPQNARTPGDLAVVQQPAAAHRIGRQIK